MGDAKTLKAQITMVAINPKAAAQTALLFSHKMVIIIVAHGISADKAITVIYPYYCGKATMILVSFRPT